MKNQRILIIASVLLILCVFEKEAHNKAMRIESVEKMYNVPDKTGTDVPEYTQSEENYAERKAFLYDPANILVVSADSAFEENNVKLTNQSMLNITSAGKLLKY